MYDPDQFSMYNLGKQKSINLWFDVNLIHGFSAGSSLERDDSDRTGSSPVIMDLSPPISIGESIFPRQ